MSIHQTRGTYTLWLVLFILLAAIPACNRANTNHVSDQEAGPSVTEQRATIEKMIAEYRKDYADVPEVSPAELVDLMAKEEVLLVDVRTPSEMEVSMIPGAITKAAFEKDKKKHAQQTIVTYCATGYRSCKYAQALQQESFKVFNLHASVLGWTHADRPLVDSQGAETRRVRLHESQWNLLPKEYTPVR